MAEYTRGPWKVIEWPDGRLVVRPEAGGKPIAIIQTGDMGRLEAIDNGYLLSAAPALLEALQLVDRVGPLWSAVLLEKVRAALSKARGQS